MTEIETSLDNYCNIYDALAEDILIGVEEGFREGLKEGIKEGFKEGVLEVKTTGFGNINIKSMDEILKNVLKAATDEAIHTTIKRTISNEYKATISGTFKKEMEKACSKVAEEIRNANVKLNKVSAYGSRTLVDTSIKRIKDCIDNSCEKFRKRHSNDMIMGSFLEGLQDGFVKDLDENLGACEKKICKEIDNKIKASQSEKSNIDARKVT